MSRCTAVSNGEQCRRNVKDGGPCWQHRPAETDTSDDGFMRQFRAAGQC